MQRGALLALSERRPSMRVYTWCNRINEIIERAPKSRHAFNKYHREVDRLFKGLS